MQQMLMGILLCTMSSSILAGKADVLDADVHCDSNSICRFSVTVKHADEGWSHYANRWEVRTLEGKIIAVRELAHPHEHEQPFTRSLGNVSIPTDIHEVVILAHDLVHGYGGAELRVKLPK